MDASSSSVAATTATVESVAAETAAPLLMTVAVIKTMPLLIAGV